MYNNHGINNRLREKVTLRVCLRPMGSSRTGFNSPYDKACA